MNLAEALGGTGTAERTGTDSHRQRSWNMFSGTVLAASCSFLAASTLAVSLVSSVAWVMAAVILLALLVVALAARLGARYIPNDAVGIVEKLISLTGSVKDGHILALGGQAGYQADLLRGGCHLFLWRFMYRIHQAPLVTVRQGKIGYVYARDGEPLEPSQTLARVVDCNHFQDARKFLMHGQRGRQRAILREGVYAINPALFVVITEDTVYHLIQGGN